MQLIFPLKRMLADYRGIEGMPDEDFGRSLADRMLSGVRFTKCVRSHEAPSGDRANFLPLLGSGLFLLPEIHE